MWRHVSSPYILKFNGVFYHDDVPAIVTPWMTHGNITEYLENHPDANRLRLVRLHVAPAPKIDSLCICSWWVLSKESSTSMGAVSRTGTSKR